MLLYVTEESCNLHAVYISKMLFFSAIPDVRVTPRIQSRRPGEEAAMFCHVIGEPFPKVCIDLNYEMHVKSFN